MVWRDESTIQIGLAPAPCALIDEADADLFSFLRSLDGRLTTEELTNLPNCPNKNRLEHIFAALTQAHALIDADACPTSKASTLRAFRTRSLKQTLIQDLTRPEPSAGSLVMKKRSESYVQINGADPLALATCHLLAAAGVKRVVIDSPDHLSQLVKPESLVGLGPDWSNVGQPALLATRAIATQFGTEVTRPRGLPKPDCEIFTAWPPPNERDRVVGEHIPHVVAISDGASATVGPLVLPSKSACLRCVELAQQRLDPRWAHIQVQLQARPAQPEQLSDSLLTTWAASFLCMGVLSHLEMLDFGTGSSLVGQRVLVATPGPKVSVERFVIDPVCGCA
jgi:hypothetical protein